MENIHRFVKRLIQNSIIVYLVLCSLSVNAQDYYGNSEKWIEKAETLKPSLIEKNVTPVSIVDIVKSNSAFQGWDAIKITGTDSLYNNSFRKIKSITLDFGEHYTGYFSFNLETLSGTSDGPTRFKLTFGEVPSEMAIPFDPYPGELSRAWLQDEVVTVMSIPQKVQLERRVSFRYLKIELLGSSPYFDFKIADINLTAVTSAVKEPSELNESVSDIIRKIDQISQKTLKECMQTVYEDGPKRDRRLWVGDMYLESLANSFTFENHQLTQRCLYLFAGLADNDGYVLGTAFETPKPHAQEGQRLMDYSLLFNASLKEYVKTTSDHETGEELWSVALRQLHIINSYMQKNSIVDYERADSEWWLFFDWKDGLNKEVAIQGLMIFALNETYELAGLLDKQRDVSYIPDLVKKMKKASLANLYNKKTGLFESGEENQISYASQVWMILAGVLSEKQRQKALNAVSNNENALFPGGPYMYHYYIQALINSGMYETAKKSLIKYWGGMVNKGADTFWEVYDPENDFRSPYNFFPVNSYCHAWSCTPTYFIRKYPEIFQK